MGKPSYVELFDRAIKNPERKKPASVEEKRAAGAKARQDARALAAHEKAKSLELHLEWKKPRKAFRLHQCYETPADMTEPECTKCKNRDFDVGGGSYFTVLRCRHCRTEVCIHDG